MNDQQLSDIARSARINIVKMIHIAGSGHPAGSLGIVEILTALYFKLLNHNPKDPLWEGRDRLIISNGHICPAQYSLMSQTGYFPAEELEKYAKLNSPLQAHPEREKLSGIETTSGPLGSGLSQAIGMALSFNLDKKTNRVCVISSDGEHDEGNHWEAVLLASKYRLSNLVMFVDRNRIQIDGTTEEVLPLGDLADKYKSFGWNCLEIDGHNFREIIEAYEKTKSLTKKPSVIIANTIAGKGVSFMENKWEWHARTPTLKELERAISELEN